jgi:hypothetical protein
MKWECMRQDFFTGKEKNVGCVFGWYSMCLAEGIAFG